jgi:hypothetical protein
MSPKEGNGKHRYNTSVPYPDPDSIRSADPDPDPGWESGSRQVEIGPQKRKIIKKFHV